MITFFGAGLLWTKEFNTIRNAWDAITVNLLIMMNGLGLIMATVIWIQRLRTRIAAEKIGLPTKLSKYSGKCG